MMNPGPAPIASAVGASPAVAATFAALSLAEPLARALAAENYTIPTPIQAQAIPHLLAGKDLVGCAQTGTGKTAAFALPVLQRLLSVPNPPRARGARVLVLCPTRELAVQIAESFTTYGRNVRFSSAVIFGGVGQDAQVRALSRGVDVLVATPGRLLDLMGQGHVKLDAVEVLVLDEADRMLDMGFVQPLRRIVATIPRQRQTVLFSATMPREIEELAQAFLRSPVKVAVTPVASTVETIDQRVLFVNREDKLALLDATLRDRAVQRVIVFTRTKHAANRVAEQLTRRQIPAEAIHGNKSQNARQRALEGFRVGQVRVLVATDLAARGIDVDGITHVINYELPNEPETYVHRIGRTARAGASGIALSFCAGDERPFLRDIERLTRRPLAVVTDHPFANRASTEPSAPPPGHRPGASRGGRRPGGGGGGGFRRR